MSLFEYAQKLLVSKTSKKRESPMPSGMGRQPVMPTAQGGGLSSVQNSLNINGQPHRLAYINPSEENLLTQLGGSGRKIDGIPSYYSTDAESDESNTAANDSIGTSNVGVGFDTPASQTAEQAEAEAAAATSGYGDTFDIQSIDNLSFDPQSPDFVPYNTPPEVFAQRSKDNLGPNKSISFNPLATLIGLISPPLGFMAKTIGIGPSFDIGIPGTATPGGYGDTGDGTQGGSGQDAADADAGADAGGGDIIIREKIAAVRQVPVKEVTVAEVQEVKRLTAAQRDPNKQIENILNDIYGSGKGRELLSLAQSGGGIASLQKNININGQPHQLSYINPSEENLLKQLGGSGEKVNGIPAYMMSGDNSGNAAGTDAANASAAADAANAAQDAAMGQVGGDVIPPEAVAILPAVPEVIVPKVVEAVPKEPKVINKNLENILATSYPNLSLTEIARMLGGVSEEANPENDFETDAKIIEILKEKGNPFPTPDDIKKFKSESNIKTVLSQVYGNSNLLNNQTGTA